MLSPIESAAESRDGSPRTQTPPVASILKARLVNRFQATGAGSAIGAHNRVGRGPLAGLGRGLPAESRASPNRDHLVGPGSDRRRSADEVARLV